jgi:hypothetical protein
MLTRGETKRILRQATRMRIRAERAMFTGNLSLTKNGIPMRLSERGNLILLKDVPSVFAFAEKLHSDYERPLWASHRYGAK